VQAKDDLISFAARKSPVIMQEASEWHKTSRALFDDPDKGVEIITGTHWATGDIYDDMQANDPSIEVMVKAAVEEGQVIFPEMFNLKTLARLETELGELYPLLYMNTAVDPRLTDFRMNDVRIYESVGGGKIEFEEDERDAKRGGQRWKERLGVVEERVTVQEAVEKGKLLGNVRVVRA
jgi:hypothetical protein